MPEIAHIAVRIVFLVALYAFVLFVARAAYLEMKPPPPRPRVAAPERRARGGRRARLVLAGDAGRGRQASWELHAEMVIGRGEECGVCVEDEFASNLHSKIYRAEGRYYVEDLGSTNGTYVNGRRIHYPTELRGGDRIKIGRTVMEFRR